jgi:hypothetical protein
LISLHEKEEFIVTTFKYGHGGTPSKKFGNYTEALEYYESQMDEKWHSVEMNKIVTQPLLRFICSEEVEVMKKIKSVQKGK